MDILVSSSMKHTKRYEVFLRFYVFVSVSYSHSIVAGGLCVMSYTTLVTSGISLVILVEIISKRLYGIFAKLAVMASLLSTALMAIV